MRAAKQGYVRLVERDMTSSVGAIEPGRRIFREEDFAFRDFFSIFLAELGDRPIDITASGVGSCRKCDCLASS